MKTAKQDLDKAKKTREKHVTEKKALKEEINDLKEEIYKSEGKAKEAHEAYQLIIKDLEDSKRKESRLREKLKEYISSGNPTNAKDLQAAKERVEHLEREIDLIKVILLQLSSSGSFAASLRRITTHLLFIIS